MGNDVSKITKRIKAVLVLGIINAVYGLIIFIISYGPIRTCSSGCAGWALGIPLYYAPALIVSIVFSLETHFITRKIRALPGDVYINPTKDKLLTIKTTSLLLLWSPSILFLLLFFA